MSYHAAGPRELQIDIDTPEALRFFFEQFDDLKHSGFLRLTAISFRYSQSGNVHIQVFLRYPLPIMERIALQCILGSDLVRERLNYRRAKNGAPDPILFIERP